jgi:hypothetical protein
LNRQARQARQARQVFFWFLNPRILLGALGVLGVLAVSSPARAAEPDDAAADKAPVEVGGEVPVIELYTMGQGDLMFEKFGHAAICVVVPGQPRKTR